MSWLRGGGNLKLVTSIANARRPIMLFWMCRSIQLTRYRLQNNHSQKLKLLKNWIQISSIVWKEIRKSFLGKEKISNKLPKVDKRNRKLSRFRRLRLTFVNKESKLYFFKNKTNKIINKEMRIKLKKNSLSRKRK